MPRARRPDQATGHRRSECSVGRRRWIHPPLRIQRYRSRQELVELPCCESPSNYAGGALSRDGRGINEAIGDATVIRESSRCIDQQTVSVTIGGTISDYHDLG